MDTHWTYRIPSLPMNIHFRRCLHFDPISRQLEDWENCSKLVDFWFVKLGKEGVSWESHIQNVHNPVLKMQSKAVFVTNYLLKCRSYDKINTCYTCFQFPFQASRFVRSTRFFNSANLCFHMEFQKLNFSLEVGSISNTDCYQRRSLLKLYPINSR